MDTESIGEQWAHARAKLVEDGASVDACDAARRWYLMGIITALSLIGRLPRGTEGLSRQVLFEALSRWNNEAVALMWSEVDP